MCRMLTKYCHIPDSAYTSYLKHVKYNLNKKLTVNVSRVDFKVTA